ncbi:TetR/AcrR family transcriptional regulator [Nocardia sp. NPDC005978]|uniref:TetR/AcrR family transcriptional regulator n=1 Tax=Nocardia sp. NPDC005978 TaxID=3156725 RepID=UPI0033A75157
MPSQDPAAPPPRGRPRRPGIDHDILRATLNILAAQGYSALSLEAVAKAAGVTRPTIYRRWPGKAALVAHALAAGLPPLAAPDTGDPLADLRTVATNFITAFTESPHAPVTFVLHAEARHDPELANHLFASYLAPRAAAVHTLITRAQATTQLRADLAPDLIRDLIFGPLVYRWLVAGEPMTRAAADQLVELSCRAVAP